VAEASSAAAASTDSVRNSTAVRRRVLCILVVVFPLAMQTRRHRIAVAF
jgi:hypothetical protein